MSGEPIFHLALADDWSAAQDDPAGYTTSTVGVTLAEEGFIHCAYAAQVQGVGDRYYAGLPDVLLLTIDPELLTSPLQLDLVGVETYPHVYGPINVDAVIAVRPLSRQPDGRLATGPLVIP